MAKKEKKWNRTKKSSKNREFAVITYTFLAAFLCLMGYFAYFQFVRSEDFINNPYNTRQEILAAQVVRGKILSADGKTLAETLTDADGEETRSYPYGRMFAHVVGYSTSGRTGIESIANFNLLRSNTFFLEKTAEELQGEKSAGDNVITTLNYELQSVAYDALGSYDGAVIVLEPSTGKILAMVSKPDYDPNNIAAEWEELVSEDNNSSVLLNRATQGLYPPGSTFKIFTTLEYIHENPEYSSYSFQCSGIFSLDDQSIRCYNGISHGTVDLRSSFANSCNASYASIGTTLDLDSFAKLCENMLFNTELPTSFAYSESSFSLDAQTSSEAEIMQTAIGQGKTLVTPFHMALVTAAIANDGVLMNPYVIDHTENEDGAIVKEYEPSTYGSLMTTDDAKLLQQYMHYVVEEGTGKKLQSESYEAYGKTGSAEFKDDSSSCHSWFVGYAHHWEKEDIAVAVLVEDSGSGSEYAVPIAKQIFDSYYASVGVE
jgi:peptidoglycan glycosyltransferase